MSEYIWTCKYCNRPLKINRLLKYVDDTGSNLCPSTEDGNEKGQHESITYVLDIGIRQFNFGHKPSYDKAVLMFEKYKNGMIKAAEMAAGVNEKIKRYIQNGWQASTQYKELEKRYDYWDNMLDNYMKGKLTDFMRNLNNIKPKE